MAFYLVVITLAYFASGTALAQQVNCTALALAGDCSFYDCLSNKFKCSDNDYPIAYGKKYCLKFEKEMNCACFTDNGKDWIRNVTTCLMTAFTDNPTYNNYSTTCKDLEKIGFESHPTCYVGNGFCTNILANGTNLVCLGKDILGSRDNYNKQAVNQVYKSAVLCTLYGATDQFLQTVNNFIGQAESFLFPLKAILGSCTAALDVIFILDASGSVGSENFEIMKSFIKDILTNFEIGPDATHVGVIRYDYFASIVIPLGSITNHTQLNNSIDNIAYTGGGTATHLALQLLISAFANDSRASQGIPKVGIVFTDGKSGNFLLTKQAADSVNKAGISTYSFGIGNGIRMKELLAIAANDSNNVFLIKNFSSESFATQLQPLKAAACTTPAIALFGSLLEGKLGKNESRLLEYDFPDEGMTIKINIKEGLLVVRGSFTIRNPMPLTEDFSVESDDTSSIVTFISPEMQKAATIGGGGVIFRKREAGDSNDEKKVYLSIVGLADNNTFTMITTAGDTVNPTSHSSGLEVTGFPLLALMLVLAVACIIS